MTYREGTNGIPKQLEDALTQAKRWSDREPPAASGTRAALEQEEWDRDAVTLLRNIIEAVEDTWGFA